MSVRYKINTNYEENCEYECQINTNLNNLHKIELVHVREALAENSCDELRRAHQKSVGTEGFEEEQSPESRQNLTL